MSKISAVADDIQNSEGNVKMPEEKVVADVIQDAEEPVKTLKERKFPYEVLKANCMKLFHVTSSTFVGATIGKESKSFTISEMQSIIETWLKKEVKE